MTIILVQVHAGALLDCLIDRNTVIRLFMDYSGEGASSKQTPSCTPWGQTRECYQAGREEQRGFGDMGTSNCSKLLFNTYKLLSGTVLYHV